MEKSGILKADIRKKVLDQRKQLTSEEMTLWDEKIKERVLTLSAFQKEQTDTVYCYIGVRGESGTESLIRHFLSEGMRVAVPRVKGKLMDFYYIKSYEDLEPGIMNIPEPVASCKLAECTTAPVIVPGVGFSEQYERTGYGAGYYDKFFEKECKHLKAAICYDFQVVEKIATEPHDILMDYVLTPAKKIGKRGE